MSIPELAMLGQILLWLVVVGAFVASGQASMFHPLAVYLAFHALVFIVRPLEIMFWGFDFGWQYMRFSPSNEDLIKTFWVTSVGLVVFATVTLVIGRAAVRFPEAQAESFSLHQKQGLVLATVLLGPLVLYSIYRTNSGFATMEQRGGVTVMTGDSGYVVEAQYMFGPLACAWLLTTRFNWRVWIPLALYIGYRAYQGWMRWTIVLLVLAITLSYLWQHRRRWVSFMVVAALLPAILLFSWLGRDRDNFKRLFGYQGSEAQPTVITGMSKEEARKIKSDGPDYANFDFLTFVLNVVPERTHSFTYGTQYLQLFTEPIPRKLWPGKPLGPPVHFFSLNDYGNFVGMTPTLLGDGWMSGGWTGLIITISLVGCFLGVMHRLFWRNINSNIFCLFYNIGLAMLPQWYRDGGISISKFLFWNLSPLIIWIFCTWMVRGRQVPVYSAVLRSGGGIRVLQAESQPRIPLASLARNQTHNNSPQTLTGSSNENQSIK